MVDAVELKTKWGDNATKAFKGKTIRCIRYMTEEEMKDFHWDHAAPVIEFVGGGWLIASQDDEGNGAGALFTSDEEIPTIPVIY